MTANKESLRCTGEEIYSLINILYKKINLNIFNLQITVVFSRKNNKKKNENLFLTNIVTFPKMFLFMKISQLLLHIYMVYLCVFVRLGATKGLIPIFLKD